MGIHYDYKSTRGDKAMKKEELYGNFKKTVQFTDETKRYADFRIQLHFDGLRQGEFFRGLVIGYLERDPDLMQFVEKLKELEGFMRRHQTPCLRRV